MCKLSEKTIEDILRQGRIYEVGGAVRDRFLFAGKQIKDRDYLVTGIGYDDLTRILRGHGRVDLVGRSFGVIKFTEYRGDKHFTFDITLPRKEFSTGVGHKEFHVTYDPGLRVEDDLIRRDFTINAMAVSLDSDELVDPFNGVLDIKNRQLRMVYKNSFTDDPLRMLRAIQFAARFSFMVEPTTFEAIRENATLIGSVSPERIAEELNKMLELAERPSEGFRLMHTTGLLKEVMPELTECIGVEQPGGYHKYDVFEHTLYVIDAAPKSLKIRMAALFHDINKPQHRRIVETGATFYGHETSGAKTAKRVLRRLRYSNDFIKNVCTLVERHMFTTDVSDKGMRRLVKRVGQELIFDLLDLRRADVVGQGMGGTTDDVDVFEKNIRAELDRKPPFTASDMPIDGHWIMRRFGLRPGPQVGAIIDFLLEQVLDDPSLNTEEKLESLAEEFYLTHIKGKDKGTDV